VSQIAVVFERVKELGIATGVWKFSGVVKLEHPALLQALTFQRYGRPGLSVVVKEVALVFVSMTRIFVVRSRTPKPYVVAPLDALQLNVTVLLPSVGPGVVVVPGLGLLGVAGIASGVWKFSGVVKLEQPAVLQALTFQRYGRPGLSVVVKEVALVFVSTTRIFVVKSRTPTP
jgi:hypothetical protein